MEDDQNPLDIWRTDPVRGCILGKIGGRRLEALGFGECHVCFVGGRRHVPVAVSLLRLLQRVDFPGNRSLTEFASRMPLYS